jgi:uncharacterized protein YdaU (DUF1376 family)
MPREAEGLLWRMWCICHLEGCCPCDVENLARKARCTMDYVSKYKSYCEPFFQLENGKLYSRRMQEEKRKSEIARNNANQRYQKSKSEPKPESESESERRSATGSANGSANHSNKPSDADASVDPRHAPIREFIKQEQRRTGVPEQWNGRCGKELHKWLKANPTVTAEQGQTFVHNKFESDLPRGAPPWEWLPTLSTYSEGPLTKFKNTWNEGDNGRSFLAGCEGMRS